MPAHPRDVLYADGGATPAIAACEHIAGSGECIDRALALQARLGPMFDITCDLENGTATGDNAATGEMIAERMTSSANRFNRMGLRIDPHGHPDWKRNIERVVGAAGARLAYVSISKVESRMTLLQVVSYVYHVAAEAGLTRPIPIHAIIETHGGLRDLINIAELPVIEALVFGLLDFVSSHNGAIPESATTSPGQFDHPLVRRAKVEVAAVAHSYARVPVHNFTTALDDPIKVSDDARRALDEFGYLRMIAIHPSQIEPIVTSMRPSAASIDRAAAIVLTAQHADWAPIRHDSRVHDRASFRHCWQVLERARATGAQLPADAYHAFFHASDQGVLQ